MSVQKVALVFLISYRSFSQIIPWHPLNPAFIQTGAFLLTK